MRYVLLGSIYIHEIDHTLRQLGFNLWDAYSRQTTPTESFPETQYVILEYQRGLKYDKDVDRRKEEVEIIETRTLGHGPGLYDADINIDDPKVVRKLVKALGLKKYEEVFPARKAARRKKR